jgi:hypothetical protein
MKKVAKVTVFEVWGIPAFHKITCQPLQEKLNKALNYTRVLIRIKG